MVAKMEGGVMVVSGLGSTIATNSTSRDPKVGGEPGDATPTGDVNKAAATERSEEKTGVIFTAREIPSTKE